MCSHGTMLTISKFRCQPFENLNAQIELKFWAWGVKTLTSDVWTPWSSKLLYSKSVVAWMQGNSARRHHFRFAHTRRVHGQMVKPLNKVRIQPGLSVGYEQSKIIEQLCVNKMSSQNFQLSCNDKKRELSLVNQTTSPPKREKDACLVCFCLPHQDKWWLLFYNCLQLLKSRPGMWHDCQYSQYFQI